MDVSTETQQQAQEEVPAQQAVPKTPEPEKKEDNLSWSKIAICASSALACMYIFLCGLSLMGSAFKVLGGRGASGMFSAVDNPVSGVMTGILATVLVQSSSTSTSIVVAMVGEGALTVKMSIPIIMGANIGTTVTNTIVAMGSMSDSVSLQRAFAGATVHDMFNYLAVATLLPIEVITGAIQGEGGMIYWISHAITVAFMGGDEGGKLFTSPIKTITKAIVGKIISANKYVIYALTLEKPLPQAAASVNETVCESLNSTRRLAASDADEEAYPQTERALLSRRMAGSDKEDCSTYYCVGKDLDKQFSKISKSSYKKLHGCEGMILGEPCGKDNCYLDAGKYYEDKVENGRLVKGGFLQGASDMAGGAIALILSLIMLCFGLWGLTTSLKTMFLGKANAILRQATKLNPYLAIVIGVGITIIVQSSSVTTSALTPLCGLGVLPLEKMLPLTLGANIGTTMTALIASLVSLKFGAVQIALCHLLFNLIGIVIWFPIPLMRKVPLAGARLMGLYASKFKFFPLVYILICFVLIPGICFIIREVFMASLGGGIVCSLFVLACFCAFMFAWLVGIPKDGVKEPLCYKVMSKEEREEKKRQLAEASGELAEAASGQV